MLLTTKRIIRSDHLSHEHGRGNHDCPTCHWSGNKFQLLTSWKPDLSVLCEGRHGGALLCVVLRQRRADLQHIWLSGLRDHHGVVERSRYRALVLRLSLLRRLSLRRLGLRLRLSLGLRLSLLRLGLLRLSLLGLSLLRLSLLGLGLCKKHVGGPPVLLQQHLDALTLDLLQLLLNQSQLLLLPMDVGLDQHCPLLQLLPEVLHGVYLSSKLHCWL